MINISNSDTKRVTWRLLQLDELLVAEVRAVVYEVVGVRRAAVRAVRGLGHAAALQLGAGGGAAHGAAEVRLAHLRHDARRADHHARQRHQLVDV